MLLPQFVGDPGLKPWARNQEIRLRGLTARDGGLLESEPTASAVGRPAYGRKP
jgi:hypothetical protein